MQAIILAAGRGTRMRPLTDRTAKPLIHILGKPLIAHVIESLPPRVDEIIVVVGYRGDEVAAHCKRMFPNLRLFFKNQETLNGTLRALELVQKLVRGPFLVLMADDIIDRASLEWLSNVDSPALLTATSQNPEKYGVVVIRKDGTIEGIEEKPPNPRSNTISTGAMRLDERIFEYEIDPHPNGERYLSVALAKLAREVSVMAAPAAQWISVGSIPDIALAEEILKNQEMQLL